MSAPLTLAIETSNPSASAGRPAVGLAKGGAPDFRWLGGEELRPASHHDDALMPAVERLVQRLNLKPRDISRVAVSLGPGGFTGCRIGLMTAKLIAEATGAECIGVPTAQALILAKPALPENAITHVLLAWKRDDVWVQRFVVRSGVWTPLDAGGLMPWRETCPSPHIAIIADPALREGIGPLQPAEFSPPAFDAQLVARASLDIAPCDPAALLPIYPREPEAVTKWRELHRDRD